MVAAFNTPIICEPGGWADTVPEWLKLRAIAERVDMVCNGGWNKATDAEITAYLYTASLSHPLTSDWTDITLYQAAKQMPQLYEALPNAPKELSDYQKQEIDHLKRDIRNSQLRRQNTRRKEDTMPTRKLVIDEKEGTVMMGVMKDGADPFIKNFQGGLETNLGVIPQLLQDAEAKWAVSLKNPTYKPPKPETKKPAAAPAATAATGGTGKSTEDLPLLAETKPPAAEKPAETTGEKPAETAQPSTPGPEAQAQEPPAAAAAPAAEATPEAQAEETPPAAETEPVKVPEQWPPVKDESEPAETGTEAPVSEPAPAAEQPVAIEPIAGATEEEKAADLETMKQDIETVPPKPEPAPTTPVAPATPSPASPVMPTTTPAPSGEWQYRLKDGRGPYDTVQAAMDEMGLDKATRPQHNRWDRLSTSLKDSIRREPKTS